MVFRNQVDLNQTGPQRRITRCFYMHFESLSTQLAPNDMVDGIPPSFLGDSSTPIQNHRRDRYE